MHTNWLNFCGIFGLVLAGTVGIASAQDARLCKTTAECAQRAVEAANQAKIAVQIAVPKGAVIAFNLAVCPEGWANFRQLSGRVVVGSGQGSGLNERNLGEVSGAETHTLTTAQMPSHTHAYRNSEHGPMLDNPHNLSAVPRYGQIGDAGTGATGGGEPHNNMQPFYVLKYCERK